MKSPSEHVEHISELTSMVILQLVNHVYFSPDGQWLASASFDKSVKLWNGITGKFVASFRGHVGPVYQIRSFYTFQYKSWFLYNVLSFPW